MKLKELLYHTKTLPLAFFLLNFVLKFLFIDAQDICIDEPFTIYHAQFPISDIVQFLQPTNNPPLFEIILHYWIKIFGISPISVRFLPVLFSSLAVIYIYKIARWSVNEKVAIIAALLFTFSGYQYYYAHDARAYSLFLLLTVYSVYQLLMIMDEAAIGKQIGFVITNVLLIYTHYFGFIVWFVLFLYLLINRFNKLKLFSVLYTVSLVFYIPQLLIFFLRTIDSTVHGTWIEEGIGAESLYNKIVLFSNAPVIAVLCLIILFSGLIKLIVVNKSTESKRVLSNLQLLLIWFFLPFFIMFFVSFKVPVFLDRYLIFITPAFYILIAYTSYALFSNELYKNVALSLIAIGFLVTVTINPSKKRDSKLTVDYVREIKDDSTLVIICAHDFINNFTYYYDQKIFSDIVPGDEYNRLTAQLNKENVYPVRRIDEISSETIVKFKKVIFLDAAADFSNPGNGIYDFLKKNYSEKSKMPFKNIFNVYQFQKN